MLAAHVPFEEIVPRGYEIKRKPKMQKAFYSHFQSMYSYQRCTQGEYPVIAYGKPYSILISPTVSPSRSFLFLMIFSQYGAVRQRNVFRKRTALWRRQYNVSYLFALTEDDDPKRRRLAREAAYYHDLLVFNHTNSYHNLALTVLLTYHFISNAGVSAVFFGKMDDDMTLNLPLLMRLLHSETVQSKRHLYAGDCMTSFYNSYDALAKNYVPRCLVLDETLIASYARGGFYVFSSDLLDFILIGSRHLTFIAHNEDANTGKALKLMNVECTPLLQGHWMARYGCESEEECRSFVSIHPKYSSREMMGYYNYLQMCSVC